MYPSLVLCIKSSTTVRDPEETFEHLKLTEIYIRPLIDRPVLPPTRAIDHVPIILQRLIDTAPARAREIATVIQVLISSSGLLYERRWRCTRCVELDFRRRWRDRG